MANIFEIIEQFAISQLLLTQKERDTAAQQKSVIRESVDSEAVDKVGYDANTLVLDITFMDGHRYEYFNVRPEIAENLVNASSVGEYFNDVIKGGFFAYRRLV